MVDNRYKKTKKWKENLSKSLKGKKKSLKHRENLSKSLKGKKLTKEHIRNRTIAQTGLKRSLKTRNKMSEIQSGKGNGFYGKTHSKSYKKRLSNEWKGEKNPLKNKVIKKKISKFMRGEWKNNRDVWMKGIIKSSKKRIGSRLSDKTKKKISKWNLNRWKDKEYKEKTLKKTLKSLRKRPTTLEKSMINFINKNKLPYKYVGDGSFWVDGKNPDFVNVNGEKICIEVGNFYHHQNNYIKERKKHFKKYGWKCVIILMDRFNENKVINKLKSDKVWE